MQKNVAETRYDKAHGGGGDDDDGGNGNHVWGGF